MVSDLLGGSGAVSGVAATGPVTPVSGTQPVRPQGQPMQATILSRPPELPAGGITQVAGTLGAALPAGEVPLSTSFGTVLLRPLPGAWPVELAPGSSVTITLGPGVRAGNIEVTAPPAIPATSTTAPAGTATASDRRSLAQALPLAAALRPAGNETALRGYLAGAAAGEPQQPVIPVLARASTASVAASAAAGQPTPGAPQAAQAQAASPPLISTAGSMQPRPVAVAQQPLPGGEAPRMVASAQTAQAVQNVAKDSGAATQDLLRQAALRPPVTGGDKPAMGAAMAPLAEDLVLPAPAGATEAPGSAPRPDQALAAALAHPGMMARMAAFMPRADRVGGLALLLYLFGARAGGVRAWLGEEQLRHVTKGETAALAELEEAMVPSTKLASDGSAWTSLLVPFMDGDRPSILLLATMGGLVLPVDPQGGREREEGGEGPAAAPGSAFTLGVDLTRLGAVQMRGLCLPGRLVLDITIAATPEPPDRQAFEEMASKSLKELDTGTILRLHWGQLPLIPDLMPGRAQPAFDRHA